MVRFEELQSLWQQQAAPSGARLASLTSDFRGYGRRQAVIHSVKLALVCVLLGGGILQARHSPWSLAGVLIIAVAGARLVEIDWRNQREIARLDFSEPSLEFVRHAIGRLMAQRDPFRKQYWPFMLCMVAGLNLIYGGLLHGALPRRIAMHLAVSLLPPAAYRLGMLVRRKRFEQECAPLIARLELLQDSLQESWR